VGLPPTARHAAGVDLALLLLRLILAAVFGAYGYAKWMGGMNQFAALLATIHIPFPEAAARAIAALELGGAALLVVGVATRLASGLLAVEMAVAISRVVWSHGFLGGYDFEATLLTAAVALTLAGGGSFSLGRDRLSR